ncbi:MAG: hypothetical protein IH600_16065 [Bacteroidetes bacterium]|nr:hypothetical protein [Bacteroidota bacterium]
MKLTFVLIRKHPLEDTAATGEERRLYSYQKEGSSQSEFDSFISDATTSKHSGFQRLITRLGELVDKHGFQRVMLYPDSDAENRTFKLRETGEKIGKQREPGLRLYGIWLSDNLFIVGNGGLKPHGQKYRKTEANPELKRIRDDLEAIKKVLLSDKRFDLNRQKTDFAAPISGITIEITD